MKIDFGNSSWHMTGKSCDSTLIKVKFLYYIYISSDNGY
jgi:hypothetical protein